MFSTILLCLNLIYRSARQQLLVLLLISAAAAAVNRTPHLSAIRLHDRPEWSYLIVCCWLQHEHPGAMRAALGVEPDDFQFIHHQLCDRSTLRNSKHTSSEEKLAYFLYICHGSLGIRHTTEHFQQSLSMISLLVTNSVLDMMLTCSDMWERSCVHSPIKTCTAHGLCFPLPTALPPVRSRPDPLFEHSSEVHWGP
jgi:hypothetical protein